MTWAYRDIQTFPARNAEAMREAVASLHTPIIFGTYQSRGQANAVASSFRHFRWCLRENPSVNSILAGFERMFDFRTQVKEALGLYTLTLVAQPSKLSELATLNPHLSDVISSACQP